MTCHRPVHRVTARVDDIGQEKETILKYSQNIFAFDERIFVKTEKNSSKVYNSGLLLIINNKYQCMFIGNNSLLNKNSTIGIVSFMIRHLATVYVVGVVMVFVTCPR